MNLPHPTDLQLIEEGLFSTIFSAKLLVDGTHRPIVIKRATTRSKYSHEPHDIIKELRLISSVSHANIIQFLGSYRNRKGHTLEIWMDDVPYSLSDLLVSPLFSPHGLSPGTLENSAYSAKELPFVLISKSIIFQVLSAIAYLHSQGIAHRDIKPQNILLTSGACVKFIDFGISWRREESSLADTLWPERQDQMYKEVCTSGHRAPELLFGPQSYDPFAVDLWSLGATFARLFTSLRLVGEFVNDGDEDQSSGALNSPFIVPRGLELDDPDARWVRDELFNAGSSEIGLAWSIFKIRGTPTVENWPSFTRLPHASRVTFTDAPVIKLDTLLPNLPPSEVSLLQEQSSASHSPPTTVKALVSDLIQHFLVYEPSRRTTASNALHHPWFSSSPNVILPPECEYASDQPREWAGRTLSEWLVDSFWDPNRK